METAMAPQSNGGIPGPRLVSESLRELETFKYDPTLFVSFRFNDTGQPFPSSEIVSCSDSILTGLAQLGVYQTNTERSLISLFNVSHQFVIAEAVPSMRIAPNLPSHLCPSPLSLCGTAVPRAQSTCEHVLYQTGASDTYKNQLPISIVPNLASDGRFNQRPYCHFGKDEQFYAAVPIRTQKGINIGVFCVLSTKQPDSWDEQSVQSMRDISLAIMDHLEATRTRHSHRRSERINRGLGSFIEGKSTLSGWQLGPNVAAFADKADMEGALDPKQQHLEHQHHKEKDHSMEYQDITLASPTLASKSDAQSNLEASTSVPGAEAHALPSPKTLPVSSPPLPSQKVSELHSSENDRDEVFSKASNIIREAFEVAGCSFFDVTLGSYRASTGQTATNGSDSDPAMSPMSSNTSDNERREALPMEGSDADCQLLGFSTAEASSINAVKPIHSHPKIGRRLLARLLRYYPDGKIFNFDAAGELQSSDLSEDDGTQQHPDTAPTQDSSVSRRGHATTAQRKSKDLRYRRIEEGFLIREAFPAARSVIFFPVWDSRRERWCAGGFIYTLDPVRVFTVEGELSFLEAFAKLITAEIHNVETRQQAQAKSDALGALSHELRSPLHGVMLSTELLNDTDLTVFQGNTTHTIETCCRTLLDTIDHLLDYSKVNSFAAMQKQEAQGAALPRPSVKRTGSMQVENKKLAINARLDGVVEEVVESMFAGFNFQHMSVRQLSTQGKGGYSDRNALNRMDSADAREQLGSNFEAMDQRHLHFGDVSVFVYIDPGCSWMFHMHAGAMRRVVMNLVGNSLKYTNTGVVRISLHQDALPSEDTESEQIVRLTVEDTGKGISSDYLQHKLFKPFTQEDELSPGTGLGLSLVKKIVSQLRGHIHVKSCIGVGTAVTVTLPLERSPQSAGLSVDDQVFEERLRDLSGLRVRLVGFESWSARRGIGVHSSLTNGKAIVERICRQLLHLELVNDQAGQIVPDLVLWSEDALPANFIDDPQLSKAPNIIICQNALVAYQRENASDAVKQDGVFEFMSQPIGPRKLAMILHLAYKRWMGLHKTLPPLSPPLSRPPGPHHIHGSHNAQAPFEAVSQAQVQNEAFEALPDSAVHSKVEPSPDTGGAAHVDVSAALPGWLGSALSGGHIEPGQESVKSKLLLVDDNHINLKVLSAFVRKLGRKYETAKNGKEALDAYIQHPSHFAGVLMDISMPIMDGLEATRQIRAFEQKSHQGTSLPVPVLVLTGLASDAVYQEALESGVNVFLTKPVRLAKLSEALEATGISTQSHLT